MRIATLCLTASIATASISGLAQETHLQPSLRRPVALVLLNDGKLLLAANRESGTLSVVDTESMRVVGERRIGRRLSDMAAAPDGRFVLVLDEAEHRLIVLDGGERDWRVAASLAVPAYPVEVVASPDGHWCYISSLWSRQLSIVDLQDPRHPQIVQRVSLPFAPRKLLLLPNGSTILVADSFAGHLALVDARNGRLLGEFSVEGHNLRGLAMAADGKSILISQQVLNADHSTTRFSVHWGEVMSNVIRAIDRADLGDDPETNQVTTNQGSERRLSGEVCYLGQPNQATGDPSDLAVTPDRRQIVAYAGVSELAVSDVGGNYFEGIPVGRRPVAVAVDARRNRVYTANMFDDSISVLQIQPLQRLGDVSLGPQRELTDAERGEMLFFDATLARDRWYSCHGCHTDGHTNQQLNDNFGDESAGAAKRVLTLLGAADTGPWTWLGKADNLPQQIRKSIETTMQGDAPTDRQLRDLTAYVLSLQPAPAVRTARSDVSPSLRRAGKDVFLKHGCSDCHAPPTFTSPDTYDVGLTDELGKRQFNPPSLRGVSQRDRLFHDGRAKNIDEVLRRLRHGQPQPIPAQELDALVHFLESL